MRGDYFPPDDGFVELVRHEPLGYVSSRVMASSFYAISEEGWALECKMETGLGMEAVMTTVD